MSRLLRTGKELITVRAEDLLDVHTRVARGVKGRGLPVITLLDGVFDAGQAVSVIRASLQDGLQRRTLAEFDADRLVDHRANRPRITYSDGHLSDYTPPRLAIDVLTDDVGAEALLFSGAEPLLAWERVTQAFGDLLDDLGAGPVSVLTAVPLPVPHTRPVTVHKEGTALPGISGSFDLPASFSHLVQTRLAERGMQVGSYTIQVPHYIAEGEYPPAAVAGLESIASTTGLAVPTEQLRQAGREVDQHLSAQLDENPDAESLVQGLETRYDASSEELDAATPLVADGEELPDGDALAAAAERFLRAVDENGGATGADGRA
jgi:hypothetical protein